MWIVAFSCVFQNTPFLPLNEAIPEVSVHSTWDSQVSFNRPFFVPSFFGVLGFLNGTGSGFANAGFLLSGTTDTNGSVTV